MAYVINYDLPEVPDNYVHRIGRTARAGREGEGIAFCSPEEVDLLRQIQKLMKIEIPVASGDARSRAEPKARARGHKQFRRGRRPKARQRRRQSLRNPTQAPRRKPAA